MSVELNRQIIICLIFSLYLYLVVLLLLFLLYLSCLLCFVNFMSSSIACVRVGLLKCCPRWWTCFWSLLGSLIGINTLPNGISNVLGKSVLIPMTLPMLLLFLRDRWSKWLFLSCWSSSRTLEIVYSKVQSSSDAEQDWVVLAQEGVGQRSAQPPGWKLMQTVCSPAALEIINNNRNNNNNNKVSA